MSLDSLRPELRAEVLAEVPAGAELDRFTIGMAALVVHLRRSNDCLALEPLVRDAERSLDAEVAERSERRRGSRERSGRQVIGVGRS